MIIVSGTFRIPEDKHGAWMSAAREMLVATRAEAGCITYSYAFDVEDRTLIRVYEEWESRERLAAHFNEPHMRVWREALAAIGAHDRDLQVHEAGAGEPL